MLIRDYGRPGGARRGRGLLVVITFCGCLGVLLLSLSLNTVYLPPQPPFSVIVGPTTAPTTEMMRMNSVVVIGPETNQTAAPHIGFPPSSASRPSP